MSTDKDGNIPEAELDKWRMLQSVENLKIKEHDSGLRIEPVDAFRGMLSDKAKKVYDVQQTHTVIEVNNPKTSKSEPKLCRYFCKPFITETGRVPDEVMRMAAAAFNKLAETDLIGYGMLLKAAVMPLVTAEKPRGAIIFYVFSDYENDRLNQELGCNCFVDEGGLGDANWDPLRALITSAT